MHPSSAVLARQSCPALACMEGAQAAARNLKGDGWYTRLIITAPSWFSTSGSAQQHECPVNMRQAPTARHPTTPSSMFAHSLRLWPVGLWRATDQVTTSRLQLWSLPVPLYNHHKLPCLPRRSAIVGVLDSVVSPCVAAEHAVRTTMVC